MKNTIKIVINLALIFSLFSCETFRDVEIPRDPDLLVVNSLFSTDSVLSIGVSKSNYIIENIHNADLSLKNAKVEVFQGETKIEDLKLVVDDPSNSFNNISFYKSTTNFKPLPNEEYSINVSAPGFSSVSSTCEIPGKIELENLQFQKTEVVIGQDYRGFPLSFEFQDEPNVDNYYRIEVNIRTELTYNDGIQTYKTTQNDWLDLSPKVQEEQKVFDNYPFKIGLYVNDLAFDGKFHKMELLVNSMHFSFLTWAIDASIDKSEIMVVLKHISKEHYEYGTSSTKQEDLLDDPFSEPIPIASNIKGGLGIFAGYTTNTLSLELEN